MISELRAIGKILKYEKGGGGLYLLLYNLYKHLKLYMSILAYLYIKHAFVEKLTI